MKGKTLVSFFSLSGDTYNVGVVKEGNTQLLANHIAKYLNGDLYHIVGDNKYPDDHMAIVRQAKDEMNSNLRPKLVNPLNNFSQYDKIFIGYPIWYKKPPMAVFSFLENFDFTNKKVFLFCTHEGSGQSGTFSLIKDILKNANVSVDGLAMKGTEARKPEAKEKAEKWLKNLKL